MILYWFLADPPKNTQASGEQNGQKQQWQVTLEAVEFSDWNDFHGAFLRHPKTSDFEGIEACQNWGARLEASLVKKKPIMNCEHQDFRPNII